MLAAAILIVVALWLFFGPNPERLSAGPAPVVVAPSADASQPSFAASNLPISTEDVAPQPLGATRSSAASVTPAADGATSLRVRVTWAADGSPAAGVALQVYFWREPGGGSRNVRRGVTDAEGEWFASPVPTGAVAAYADRGVAGGAKIEPGQAALIELTLPPGFDLRGLVVNEQGEPVAGADIWLSMEQNDQEGQVVTSSDARGRFELRDLKVGGRQALAARSADYAPSSLVHVDGEVGESRDVLLALGGDCGSVRGVVLDPDSNPVPGARVTIGHDYGFELPGDARTPSCDLRCDAQGAFLAAGLPVGVQPIAAVAPGWSPTDRATSLIDGKPLTSTGVIVESGKTTDVTLQLQRSASLSGTARDDAGQPVFWATVRVHAPLELLCAEANTSADGRYEIRDAPAGLLEIDAQHEDAGRAKTRLKLVAGEAQTWDPQLTLGKRIAGLLLDAHGVPAGGRNVWVQPHDGRAGSSSSTTTDSNGRFEVQGLDAGPVDVSLTQARGSLLLASAVPAGQTDLVLRLPEGVDLPSTVIGRVVDPLGLPVPGCEVSISSVAGHSSWRAPVDAATGRFTLADLSPGQFVATVDAPPAPGVTSATVEVAGGQTGDFGDLVLAQGGRVALRLTAPGVIEERRVLAVLAAESGNKGARLTRDDDIWLSTRVPAGRYTLNLQPMDFGAVRKPVLIEDGRDTFIDVALQAGVPQRIRIFGAAAESGDTLFSLTVRAAGGDPVIVIPTGKLPSRSELLAPAKPVIDFTFCLAPGAYVVDASLAAKSATGVPFSITPGTAWDIDLR